MIVENKCDNITNWYDDENPILMTQWCNGGFQQYLQKNAELRNGEVHHCLQ